MGNHTLQYYKIINNTIGITSEKYLLVSWTINFTALHSLKYPSHIKTETNFKPAIIINLPDETECHKELESKWWYLHFWRPDWFIGISFSESLIHCDFTVEMRKYAKILIVRIKFGNTIGVHESFGLFQNRFKFLSDSTTSLVRYTPTNELRNFSITPSIANPSLTYLRGPFSWLPLMIVAGFQKHQSFILKDYLGQLITDKQGPHVDSQVTLSPALPLDIIVDYTDDILQFARLSLLPAWELVENSMMRSISLGLVNSTGAKLSTIVFHLNKKCYTNELCEYNNDNTVVEFARKMKASNIVIACVFLSESFEQVDPPAVVNACNEINGTVYILRTTISLYWNQDVSSYSLYFENTVRKKLEEANEIRKFIINEQPLAKVHLELTVKEDGSHGKYFADMNSLFCDEVGIELNPYFEAIINWANLKTFPIILIRDSQSRNYHSIYHALFSMLRQLNNPYLEWSLQGEKEKIETEFQLKSSTIETHPSFLMKNYLTSNYNWKIDSCINWEAGKSVLKDTHIYSNYVGTTFRTENMVINRTSGLEEYIIKLQFIFHRFQLIEIVGGTNFPKLVDGISLAIKVANISNPKIFVCYVASNENPHTEVRNFQSLLHSVTGKASYESLGLSGIHVELVHKKIYLDEEVAYNITNADSVSTMLNVIKQSRLKAGLLTSVKICGEMIKNTILPQGNLGAELLRKVDYIICNEEDGYRFKDGKRLDYEHILDTHLFIKRLANLFFPHLEVYFRVEPLLEINANPNIVQRYLSLVDLFQTFGKAYDISYFIIEAFDNQLREEKTGWWGIGNSSDLTNPKSYVEKPLVYNGQVMWYPPTINKPSNLQTTNGTPNTIIMLAGLAVIVVLIALMLAVIVRYRKLQQILSDEEVKDFVNGKARGNIELQEMGTDEARDLKYMKFNPDHNLELSDIYIDNANILGQGAFGTVYKGTVKDDAAAIKRPNADCSKSTFMNVLMEVKVHSYVGSHPNVVNILGAYIKEIHNGILYIATEFCSNGSLQEYLRKRVKVISNPEVNTYDVEEFSLHQLDLSRFSLEIAKGMEYIGSKNIVHGDLASRNVLLNENLVCKIGDFGLSRKLYEYQKYVKTSQEPLPWKWMAYESLTKMEFTPKSDVWSYGVTLWEIYSLGKVPYAGLNWSVTFAEELLNGLRPTMPQFASMEIHKQMGECWNIDVNERPSFTELSTFFQGLSNEPYSVLEPL
ncbi:unnamed protein product [Orchesella dallaii]|uniref:Protein kinase domain-containing protein n=1 Tax=Orchesella dallaii TaxID=48710 RepID=A0ABP1PLC8_9HEXA